jgi:translation initiation factor 2B subunit (eIF-2B alpha/beta/delta family)
MDSKAFNTILFQQESGQWEADVAFRRDELKVLSRYLQEVIDKNTTSDMKDEITQFQRKLAEKIEISYELLAAIKIHEEMLCAAMPDSEDVEEARVVLKEKITQFCKSYSAFKSLFIRFLARADFIV